MKKRFLVLLIVMCLVLTGCGKAKKVPNDVDKKMMGSYQLTEIKGDKKKYSRKEMEQAKEKYLIHIRGKGEAILIKDGKDHFVEYNTKYILSTDKNGDPEETKYKFKDGKIIVRYDDRKFIFTKVKDPIKEAEKAARKLKTTVTTKK